MSQLIFRANVPNFEYPIFFETISSRPVNFDVNYYNKFFVLADHNTKPYADALPFDVELIEVECGEQCKSISTCVEVYNRLEAGGATRRSSILFGLGGGAICDLAGYIAMTYMRGISYALYPTTLVAMADAAVGSKVAINGLSGSKNLIGGFWSPCFVQIDLGTLKSLREREYKSAFAEIIKIACIAGDGGLMLNYLEKNIQELLTLSISELLYVLECAIKLKIKYVEPDLLEQNLNRPLNLGHTLGHAIEASSNYRLLHGESVAIGLAQAFRIGMKRRLCSVSFARKIIHLLELFKLPVKIPDWLSVFRLRYELEIIRSVRNNSLREVIPISPGFVKIIHDVEAEELIQDYWSCS